MMILRPQIAMNKDFLLLKTLTPRDCEVIDAEIHAALQGGADRFQFRLAPDFLPSITWLERVRLVLSPIVEKKLAVEILCYSSQKKSLLAAGFHLIADVGLIKAAT